MAVIKPSLKFDGSELNLSASATPYIKEGVRKAVFNKTTNQDGAYLYFLPAYKADANDSGVWYKRITIRDNFGANFKEKYYVANRAEDPAEYFANNFRILYPEEAKVGKIDVNGKQFPKYPNHGRIAERVIYNVAFAQNLGLGAHLLDLPLRNGADQLMNWLDGRDIAGNPRNPINDPERCVPVFVKLKQDAGANPWVIQVENNQPVQLPLQLADSDYLYNLDDILVHKSKEEIITKLREIYPADVFDDCMHGYPGMAKNTVAAKPKAVVGRDASKTYDENSDAGYPAPPKFTVPVVDIPKASISAPKAAVNAPPVADLSALPPNPMSNKMSREEAMRFINQQ